MGSFPYNFFNGYFSVKSIKNSNWHKRHKRHTAHKFYRKSYADKNKALQDEIDSKYSELGRLKEQCMRAESRWNAMKTSENLEKSMLRHGIDMGLPQAHQIVKMGKDGKPIAPQHSVAWFAKNRRERGNVVRSATGL